MDLTWPHLACLQMLCLAVPTACSPGSPGKLSHACVTLGKFQRRVVWKRLRRHLPSRQEKPQKREEDRGHKIQRVRRSWLSDYLEDLWSHAYHSFPRAALYAFPGALLIMLLLCCATILLD